LVAGALGEKRTAAPHVLRLLASASGVLWDWDEVYGLGFDVEAEAGACVAAFSG
jgi:hypothetical protein